jgi:hypothetical protein
LARRKASPHAAYIARIGQYEKRLERGEKLEASEFGNMPKWAASNPLQFWEAADANERKNGTTYREFEIALPREMNPAQRLELVRDFVEQEIGDRHAYQFAIHTPTAADGGEQPHAHVIFPSGRSMASTATRNSISSGTTARTRSAAEPKGYGESAGQTLSRSERADELKALRGRWEEMCNAHLDRASIEARIDMRSHAERGTGLAPEVKQLPSQWRDRSSGPTSSTFGKPAASSRRPTKPFPRDPTQARRLSAFRLSASSGPSRRKRPTPPSW